MNDDAYKLLLGLPFIPPGTTDIIADIGKQVSLPTVDKSLSPLIAPNVPIKVDNDQISAGAALTNNLPYAGKVDEEKFRNWYSNWARNLGLNDDPDNPNNFYDYRAAWLAGAEPKPDPYGVYHWPSQYKLPGHPREFVDTEKGLLDTKTGKILKGDSKPQATGVAVSTHTPGYAGVNVAMPAPTSSHTPTPTPTSSLTPSPTPEPADVSSEFWAGRFPAAMGALASAIDPKQFGQAGQMLTGLGLKEVEKQKADAVARAAGFKSAEEMEGFGKKVEMEAKQAQTRQILEGTLPYTKAQIPETAARTGLLSQQAEHTRLQNIAAERMLPQKFDVPGIGPVTIDPKTFVESWQRQTGLALEHMKVADQIKTTNPAMAAHHWAQARQLSEKVPYPGVPNGLSPELWVKMQTATNKDWTSKNQRWIKMAEDVDKQLSETLALNRDPAAWRPNFKNYLKVVANAFLQNPDFMWKGIGLYTLLGEAPPTELVQAPSASQALTGKTSSTKTSVSGKPIPSQPPWLSEKR